MADSRGVKFLNEVEQAIDKLLDTYKDVSVMLEHDARGQYPMLTIRVKHWQSEDRKERKRVMTK